MKHDLPVAMKNKCGFKARVIAKKISGKNSPKRLAPKKFAPKKSCA